MSRIRSLQFISLCVQIYDSAFFFYQIFSLYLKVGMMYWYLLVPIPSVKYFDITVKLLNESC